MKKYDLHLYEELMLLSLNDAKGTIETGAWYHHAVGGAALAELLMEGWLKLEERGRKKPLVIAAKEGSTGDELLDDCMEKVRTAKKRGDAAAWVSRFSNIKGLKGRVATGLCRKGILRADEDKILLLFKRQVYPEVDPGPERALIARLQKAVLSDSTSVNAHTVVLVSLAHATGILKNAVDRKEVKRRKKRIEALANGDVAVKATRDVIAGVQAAVMVCCIMPAVTVT